MSKTHKKNQNASPRPKFESGNFTRECQADIIIRVAFSIFECVGEGNFRIWGVKILDGRGRALKLEAFSGEARNRSTKVARSGRRDRWEFSLQERYRGA